ncbi:3-deoxy-7-phosphoheptulonate synthase [Atractiella rhizophila]|nr:3-deoxy-7-phosphoheptulonate synthase [Atractiella rhizophila]
MMDDTRIKGYRPLLPPQILMEEYPANINAIQTVAKGRKGVEDILNGNDDRLFVVVGPCSVHDVKAALEYAEKLRQYATEARGDLHILMRVYFEKPRTTVGWKGLINDPHLDGSFNINTGLRLARALLLEIVSSGLPTACEFLDVISPQYTADLVSWGAIGARTTESQVHRELASALSAPVGFKNGTDGSVSIAIDAIRAASSEHVFLSVTKQGLSAIFETTGNPSTHIILRGSNSGPNYEKEFVKKVAGELEKAQLTPKIMIDCSHGNSKKDYRNQSIVAEDIMKQLSDPDGSGTAKNIVGVMIESNLNEGKQSIPQEGPEGLKYGVSVTDSCLSWAKTVEVLEMLRQGVKARRMNSKTNGSISPKRNSAWSGAQTPGQAPPTGQKFNSLDMFKRH